MQASASRTTPSLWRSLEIRVKSSDKSKELDYTVTLKQMPSNFSQLENISVFENCTLDLLRIASIHV